MKVDNYKKISVVLPNEAFTQLLEIANKEKHTLTQQIAIIIMTYLNDHNKMLEIINEDDFGVITEDKLRAFLKKEENQVDYKYEDIENLSFEELFKFWIEKFSSKSGL